MNFEEFKTLTTETKVDLINKRLVELKKERLGPKAFKSEELDFSLSTATKELIALGYARNANGFAKNHQLTEEELIKLKSLVYSYDFVLDWKGYDPKVKKRNDDEVATTSVRMYSKVWKRWQEFAREWSIFNSIDLMASALEEYMNRYDFHTYEELVRKGKIKD